MLKLTDKLSWMLLLVFASGCNHYTYMPLMPSEVFYAPGEVKLKGALGFNHVEGQASYTPFKHIGFSAGGFWGSANRIAFNGAVGLHCFKPYKNSPGGIGASLNAGYEYGSLYGNEAHSSPLFISASYEHSYRIGYQGLFAQPAFFFRESYNSRFGRTNWSVGFGARFSSSYFDTYSYGVRKLPSSGSFYSWEIGGPFTYRLISPFMSMEWSLGETGSRTRFVWGLQFGGHMREAKTPAVYDSAGKLNDKAPEHQNFFVNTYLGISLGRLKK